MEFQEHKRLIELLPEFLRKYREYRAITTTEQIELDKVHLWISDLLSDAFTETATEEGISRKERMYGMKTAENMTLEDRRLAVKIKESNFSPYTIRRHREMLSAICGEGNFEIVLEPDNYTLRVIVPVEKGGWTVAEAVTKLSKNVLPANLVYLYVLRHDVFVPVQSAYHAGIVFTADVVARDKTYAGHKKIRFDGAWRWDGSVRLNETPYGWDANGLYEIGCVFGASVPQKVTVESAQEHKAEIPVSVSVKSGGADLTAGAREVCEIERPAVTVSAGTVCETGYGAEIEVRKNLWRLDGTVRLDGSRRLNAEEYTVKL